MNLSDFKNKHLNETICIIGSGKSIDFFPNKNMFQYMTTIGVNYAIKHIPVTYSITHHHTILQECVDAKKTLNQNAIIFTSKYDCGIILPDKNILKESSEYVLYEHNDQLFLKFDPSIITTPSDNHLFVGGTIVIDAISLALHMGAKNIILVGCDAGSINDKSNYDGYMTNQPEKIVEYQHFHSVSTVNIIKQYRNELLKRGVSICSLSPFLDYRLEGNIYDYQIKQLDK